MPKCDICNKVNNSSRKYSYRGTNVTKRTLTVQKPNVKKVKVLKDGNLRRIHACVRCIRSNRLLNFNS